MMSRNTRVASGRTEMSASYGAAEALHVALQLVEHLFRFTLANRLEAQTDAENIAEQSALERIGFKREGVLRAVRFRHGIWRDMMIYGLLRTEVSLPLR
jgi:RimJ/RimL family protein N-acetyltransferase